MRYEKLLRGRLKIRRQLLDLGQADLVGVAREAVLLGQEEHTMAFVALAPVWTSNFGRPTQ